MQVMESELVIPLKYKVRLRGIFLYTGICLVFSVGLFSFMMISSLHLMARTSQFPALQEEARQEVLFGIIALFLTLVLYGTLLLWLIRQWRAPSPYVRISPEGIFTSRDALLITWAQIKALTPATFMGVPYLQIVPWNVEEVMAQAKASSRPKRRLMLTATQVLFHSSKSPAPIGFLQRVLPISIHELLTAIQEQFGPQLREHHILIGEAQR